MVYFYHQELLSVDLWTNQDVHELCLEYKFSHPGQEDGHCPAHGDDKRDFAEVVFAHLPRQEVAEVLEKHGIVDIKKVLSYNIKVEDLNVISADAFMPLLKMTLSIKFTSTTGSQYLAANQLLKSISWEDAKKAIFEGYSSCHCWP